MKWIRQQNGDYVCGRWAIRRLSNVKKESPIDNALHDSGSWKQWQVYLDGQIFWDSSGHRIRERHLAEAKRLVAAMDQRWKREGSIKVSNTGSMNRNRKVVSLPLNKARWCFEEDDEGHWYMIPADQRRHFREALDIGWQDSWEKFNSAWEEYRIPGSPSLYSFQDPKEDR